MARWGETVANLRRCLEQHAHDRGLDRDKAKYWVCAFACNQWQLYKESEANPAQSAFARALRLSRGGARSRAPTLDLEPSSASALPRLQPRTSRALPLLL